MSYPIRWSREALDFLTEIWLASPGERSEISEAASTVDRLLQVNPLEEGEARDGNRRIAFVPPLAVMFRVDQVDRIVYILNVRHMRRRGTA